MIICSCKSVSKTEVLKAIRKGATVITEIQTLTKASTGCGRCKSSIQAIIDKEAEKVKNKDQQLRIEF